MASDPLRRLIAERLAAQAEAHAVRVLYACESGSRAWGFPSPDSDYDIRFLYAHPAAWYVCVEESRDVIETPLEDTPAGLLDLGGWDLRKAFRLARKSNPVIWEWLQSPVVYQPFDTHTLRQTLDPFDSPIAACHHYLSLSRNTMARELTGADVKIKKYFYMLRPLLAAAWIERWRTIPPMEFKPLLVLLDDRADILDAISELLQRKQHTDERIPIPRLPVLDSFIETEVSRLRDAAPNLPAANGDMQALDNLLRQLLGV
ncbi:MAG: DNA polymerase beta superfamily protein [Candidatus Methylumidiphilus sp.]